MSWLKFAMVMIIVGTLVGCEPGDDLPNSPPPGTHPEEESPSANEGPAADPPSTDISTGDPPAADPSVGDPPTGEPPAADPLAEGRMLDFKNAERLEIRHSMLGFRNTLLFYTFADQQAVVTLLVDNQDESFPVKGTVYLFAKDTSEEALKKWINNQHSDGLYPEVPQPTVTEVIPQDSCRVTSFEEVGTSENPPTSTTFKDYKVELAVDEVTVEGKFRLTAFTDTTTVHVKAE